ncbi:MAG: L,D-transpeptidase [Gemmatimonadetes bacterium]|jgi:L,D-transpeptidase ErfK/SrfK|nr:L,D-transpeptidase [Gemmatimonadota bacterium]MBT7860718.1 L,D-transpeptidase [Gemmatimonadota bacterium]
MGATASDTLRHEHHRLLAQLTHAPMSTPYLVIDTRDNLVQLRDRDHTLLHSAVAATGAARRFEGPKTWKQSWQFSTPAGQFHIQRKVADPLWVKPEWAFLEADEEVPIFAEDPRRFQRGVLGRYALYFAKDLMIHGTLYEVNLGKSITHGCVRVGADDLQYFYEHVDVGWPVYIY